MTTHVIDDIGHTHLSLKDQGELAARQKDVDTRAVDVKRTPANSEITRG
jgi:hypothetical protein